MHPNTEPQSHPPQRTLPSWAARSLLAAAVLTGAGCAPDATTPNTTPSAISVDIGPSATTPPDTTPTHPSTTTTPETVPTSTTAVEAISPLEFDTTPEHGARLATLEIPSINLLAGVYSGIEGDVIDKPTVMTDDGKEEKTIGFDPRSDLPGRIDLDGGRTILFAHRTTHSAPGLFFDKIPDGGMLIMTDNKGNQQILYKVAVNIFPALKPDDIIDPNDPNNLVNFLSKPGPGDGSIELVIQACSNPDGTAGEKEPDSGSDDPYTASDRIFVTFSSNPPTIEQLQRDQ